MHEIKLQTDCFQFHWSNYPNHRRQLFHVPNGGKRNPREAQTLKQSGVVAGVPDLVFCFSGETYFFELKTKNGQLSPNQKKIHYIYKKNGFPVFIIKSLIQFQTIYIYLTMPSLTEIEKNESIKTLNLSQKEWDYQKKVFDYLFTLRPGSCVKLETIVNEDTLNDFIGVVKKFMYFGMDQANGFDLQFDEHWSTLSKKELINIKNGTEVN
jgi:hypothetical protein